MPFRICVDKKCYRCYVEIDASDKQTAEADAIEMALKNKLKFKPIPEGQQYTAALVKPLPHQEVM